jgi:hypothetical protein
MKESRTAQTRENNHQTGDKIQKIQESNQDATIITGLSSQINKDQSQ